MISIFSIALLTQILLVLSGLAVLQLVNYKARIQALPLLPYAWGVGVVLLYLGGWIFVKSEWLLNDWHWVVASFMLTLTLVSTIIYLQRQPKHQEITQSFASTIRWYDALIITFILVKVSLVGYICMVNSVVDSDATSMRGYVALGKKIGEAISVSEVMERARGLGSPIGPSLLPAWIRLFMDRWHDSVTSLPWLLAWLFSGSIAFVTCHKLSRHLTASLVCAYLILSFPLAALHVFRSGFIELLVMYFFIMGISVISMAFLTKEKVPPVWLAVAIIAILGVALCKPEGKMWALFLTVIWVSYYLYVYKNIPWKKLILVQALLAAVLFLIYYFVLDEAFFRSLGDPRLGLIAPRAFEQQAFFMTINTLYQSGSFGILWWAVSLGGVYVLIAKKVSTNTKAMVFYIFAILLAIIYFANFTENIRFTLIGTNVSRFLLQVSGLFIPLYCALILMWFPHPQKNNPVIK